MVIGIDVRSSGAHPTASQVCTVGICAKVYDATADNMTDLSKRQWAVAGMQTPEKSQSGDMDYKDFDETTWESQWKDNWMLLGWMQGNGTALTTVSREVREYLDSLIRGVPAGRIHIVSTDGTVQASRLNILLASFNGVNSTLNCVFGEDGTSEDDRDATVGVRCLKSIAFAGVKPHVPESIDEYVAKHVLPEDKAEAVAKLFWAAIAMHTKSARKSN